MGSLEDRIIDLDDDGICYIWYESAHLPEPPISDEERQEAMVVARELIQAKYDAGTPLFTKEQFRTIVQQLDQCSENENDTQKRVSITGLDGQTVWFPVETGKESTMHFFDKMKYKGFLYDSDPLSRCVGDGWTDEPAEQNRSLTTTASNRSSGQPASRMSRS